MSKRDPVFKTWISDTGLEKRIITDTPNIEYVPLVDRIVRILEILLKSNANGLNLTSGENQGGVDMSNFSWVLKEYELINVLVSQLELMPNNDRRQCLLSLQYTLTDADYKQDGDVDGFIILQALLKAGFRLQRFNRYVHICVCMHIRIHNAYAFIVCTSAGFVC
jgi:hypothetical protein